MQRNMLSPARIESKYGIAKPEIYCSTGHRRLEKFQHGSGHTASFAFRIRTASDRHPAELDP